MCWSFVNFCLEYLNPCPLFCRAIRFNVKQRQFDIGLSLLCLPHHHWEHSRTIFPGQWQTQSSLHTVDYLQPLLQLFLLFNQRIWSGVAKRNTRPQSFGESIKTNKQTKITCLVVFENSAIGKHTGPWSSGGSQRILDPHFLSFLLEKPMLKSHKVA